MDASALFEQLRQFDTPTICNALEIAKGARFTTGFTRQRLLAASAKLPSIVGYARTVMIRCSEPFDGAARKQKLLGYYEYLAQPAQPSISVVQDIDSQAGLGAFWGEVNTNIHMSLGAVGCVTNGSFRDLAASAKKFQIVGGRVGPSHAHIHVVDFGRPVNVFGMQAAHDDVIHADCHGAVVIPADCVKKLPAVIDLLARREKVILDLCASPDFTPAKLREAFAKSRDIH